MILEKIRFYLWKVELGFFWTYALIHLPDPCGLMGINMVSKSKTVTKLMTWYLLLHNALSAMLSWSLWTASSGVCTCWLLLVYLPTYNHLSCWWRLSISDLNYYTSLLVDPCYYLKARKFHVCHDIHLSARMKFTLTQDLGMFQIRSYTMCGNPNKVNPRDNSPQLTLRFT